jgi:hypothetical protein
MTLENVFFNNFASYYFLLTAATDMYLSPKASTNLNQGTLMPINTAMDVSKPAKLISRFT